MVGEILVLDGPKEQMVERALHIENLDVEKRRTENLNGENHPERQGISMDDGDGLPEGSERAVEVLAGCFGIRRRVFVDEQEVPAEEEWDGRDCEAVHFLLRIDGDEVATARLREMGDGRGKLERMAVDAERRGEGWGGRIVRALENYAVQHGFREIKLHGQERVSGFYESQGYRILEGEYGETGKAGSDHPVFYEAGIPHVEMIKEMD
ncbi:MAG: GNAT family N-acetyltransferase [Halobacteria archaeon]